MNAEVGQAALALYCATVRATLFVCKGYECQEKEGVFMTAFPGPIKALEWAVTLQMALLRCDMLLLLPNIPLGRRCVLDGMLSAWLLVPWAGSMLCCMYNPTHPAASHYQPKPLLRSPLTRFACACFTKL